MDDAVLQFCAAVEARDMPGLAETLARDVELPSPLFRRAVFKGREDVTTLLTAVYGMLRDVRWDPPVGNGTQRLAIAHASLGPMKIDDAMVFELDADGRITRVRPHLRPLLALILFLLMIGPRIARTPLVMLRAMRS